MAYNNGGYRNRRINEQDVPESKHTVFVRGLTGDIQTDDIKEYLSPRIGRVTFDFVKVTQDRSKIFVAIRFETRDEAREFMDKYMDREFMGCRCELTWFRDIRRYAAYQAAKSMKRNEGERRRRRRSDSDETGRESSPPSRAHTRSRSRSPSRRRSRSTSRGSESKRSRSRSRHASPAMSDSDDEIERKKSRRSNSSDDYSPSNRRRGADVSDIAASPISDRSRSPAVGRKPMACLVKRGETPPLPPPREPSPIPVVAPPPRHPSPTPVAPPPKEPSPSGFIPPPSVQEEDSFAAKPSMIPNKEIKFKLRGVDELMTPTACAVQNTKIVVGLETDEPPKTVVRENMAPPPPPSSWGLQASTPSETSTLTTSTYASYPLVSAKSEPESPAANHSQLNGFRDSVKRYPTTDKMFGHLKEFQSTLISSVKYEPKEESFESLNALRLSSLANDEDMESQRNAERERKLAALNEEQQLRFTIKKKQFELAYKSDCQTYAIVTKALLSKDESLAGPIKVALLENIDDLYQQFLKRIDDFLDTLAV
ncbi:unnamed protein product [Caenorhabditis bovis]|uniref:RRM domain-containing protein n=1 Tax=Caenorhabditis bovis TaxID=2654633 RepID=A0A8S1F6T2_9PELO|nr:unnamed protein product [Caenorhabditis bovis]